ncbi:efflux RND transporter permease subunit [Luedemannella helvata]|uniref:Efflux RND transporter permease subunit n=1 Tax=Luedemannella helvata TaxID=349315 RepID=A0ABN2KX73_9ACTN
MSRLARLSLANRGLTALIAIVVTAFGLLTIPSLKQQLFPSIDFPGAFVSATFPGASPEVVEEQVTAPIENALQGTPGLKKYSSTSREGLSLVQIELDFGTDLDAAVAKMESSLNRIAAQLPDGVDPQVFAGSTDEFPVVVLAVSGDGDQDVLADKLRSTVLPKIQAIDGVREAELTGVRDKQVVITPDPVKLAAAGVDASAIATLLRTNGIAIPAGTLTEGDRSVNVQVGTPVTTVDQLKGLYLASTKGKPVTLGEVAGVVAQPAEVTSITRTNGKPSLGIAVTATPDGNAVGISHEIRDLIPELKTDLGAGAELTPVFDQAPFVEKSIEGLTTEGLLGLIMAIIVILVFLLSVRSTIVTAVSIPLSVVVALLALGTFDYSLNVLTLGALTIAIGRVVDDSIVVLENIKRHLGYGEERREAILTAVREVAGAVTASTLTTVAVFSPIALVGGIVGQLFSSFAITVTVALLASLVVSLTIIPVLAYWFLRPAATTDLAATRAAADEKERRSLLQRTYVPVIGFATRRRWTTLGLGLLVLFVTFGLGNQLKTNFFDQSGQNALSITQKMPVGTSLAATDAAAKKVEAILERTEGVQTYQVSIGGAGAFGFGGSGAGAADFSLTVDEDHDALTLMDQLRAETAKLTDAGEIKVDAGSGGGFSASNLQVIVTAPDAGTLRTASEQVRAAMAGVANIADVTTDLASSSPRLQVTVDRDAAAEAGLTEATIGQSVSAAFRGTPLGQYSLDGSQRTVVLRFGAAPVSAAQVENLPLVTPAGIVPLKQVAKVATVDGPVQVTRSEGKRVVTVSGTAVSDNVGAVSQDLTKALEKLTLPGGATYELGGASADQSEAFASLGLALLAAIAIVFMIMAATFKSLVQPLILMVSIPFAATGAIALLLATDTALGVPALIGMLMLVGIVVTNAIVLLDLINQYREQGMSVRDAVIEGGRHRLRPILMTAVATIFALLPMALGLTGSGGFISKPLAIVVIGGLLSSTLLTLVLVPTLYTMVEGRKERRAAKRAARAAAAGPAPEQRTDEPVTAQA